MRKIVTALCWIMPLVISAQEKILVNFSNANNWKELLAEATRAKKPIFIDAYATWCGPCKQMDQEVFSNVNVAAYINDYFVSVKLQMDSTLGDDDRIKGWRKDLKNLAVHITGYPCFLAFTPEGEYMGKLLGYHSTNDFIRSLQAMIENGNRYLDQIHRFRLGELTKPQLLMLASWTKENKPTIADSIALFFKRKYIDNASIDSILQPDEVKFIGEFYQQFRATDKIVRYIFEHPGAADSIFDRAGFVGTGIGDAIISNDYIYRYLFVKERPVKPLRSWRLMETTIANDFDLPTARRLVLNAKIFWAYKQTNIEEAIKYEFEKIEKYGLDTTALGRAFFNNKMMNEVFIKINNIKLLKTAAQMMKYINNIEKNESSSHLDTYAMLLYKIGKKKQALAIEGLALKIAKEKNDEKNVRYYSDMIEKMGRNEKIWEQL